MAGDSALSSAVRAATSSPWAARYAAPAASRSAQARNRSPAGRSSALITTTLSRLADASIAVVQRARWSAFSRIATVGADWAAMNETCSTDSVL